ncbi:MAG: hypothetical protein IPF92_08915 [Myxococcales bacterium]|nr:hypothetical protein [Myxococcales bacterium]
MSVANLGRRATLLLLPAAVAAAVVAGSGTKASADEDPAAKNERCATRVSIALLGSSPSAALATNPQGQIDTLVSDPAFIERFSRFLNASFNNDPGATSKEDASYHLAKHILENKKPYADLFVGQYKVDGDNQGNNVQVTADPNGLGYFRSQPWLLRYAGNELEGYKIVTAYRIMQNTVGLELVASTNAPGVDVSAGTRTTNPGCKGCHADSWYALDKAARVLTKVVRQGNNTTFTPPTDGPQQVADKTVTNDKELVEALVGSPNFGFNACRLAFNFLYGRPENACESKVFDACVTEFKAKGTIQSAVASVAKDPGFCQ